MYLIKLTFPPPIIKEPPKNYPKKIKDKNDKLSQVLNETEITFQGGFVSFFGVLPHPVVSLHSEH